MLTLAAEYDIVVPALPRWVVLTILSLLILTTVAAVLWVLNRRAR